MRKMKYIGRHIFLFAGLHVTPTEFFFFFIRLAIGKKEWHGETFAISHF